MGDQSIADAMEQSWREEDERRTREAETAAPASDSYTGEACAKCSRVRVYLRRDGQTVCEKCSWLQERGEYADAAAV